MAWIESAIELWPLVALLAALGALAVAISVFSPRRRSRLRRVAVLTGMALAVGSTHLALKAAGFEVAAHWVLLVTHLLGAFAVVNLAAVTTFDLLLERLGVRPAAIVYELVLASAWMLAAVVVLTTWGVDLTGVVAASTVAAAIFTFSLQATLGNVLGGIAVQFDGSIRAGDWLQLQDGRQGRVREIRWRHTVLETRDGGAVVVPNSSLLSDLITILGRSGAHRMSIEFVTDVTTPPEEVVRVVSEALRASPIENVVAHPAADCVCTDIGGRSAGFNTFLARVWVADLGPDLPTATRVRERVHVALRRANHAFGAPTLGLYGAGPGGERETRNLAALRRRARGVLDRCSLFAVLTPEEKDRIAENLQPAPHLLGEVITRQGAIAHSLYLLAAGRVRVVTNVDGFEAVVTTLEAPTFFGEMGLMTGEPRSASVIAETDVECWRLDKPDFDEVLRHRLELAEELSALLAHRRVELSDVRSGVDASGGALQEQARILTRIRQFFGLGGVA